MKEWMSNDASRRRGFLCLGEGLGIKLQLGVVAFDVRLVELCRSCCQTRLIPSGLGFDIFPRSEEVFMLFRQHHCI